MPPRQLVSRFALLATYTVAFVLLWPWAGERYGRAFREGTMGMCRAIGASWVVVLKPLERPTAHVDSEMFLIHRQARESVSQTLSSRYIGYAPTTFLVALILATPLTWRRRLIALLWGLVLTHAWIAFSMLLLIVHGYSRGDVISIFDVSPFTRDVLAFLREALVQAPVIKYTVPAVIWMLVSFRRSDWARLLGTTKVNDSSSPDGKA